MADESLVRLLGRRRRAGTRWTLTVAERDAALPPASYDHLDDGALVAACREGRADAFDVIVARHRRAVYQVCYRFSGNHEDASDLAAGHLRARLARPRRLQGTGGVFHLDIPNRRQRVPESCAAEIRDTSRSMATISWTRAPPIRATASYRTSVRGESGRPSRVFPRNSARP